MVCGMCGGMCFNMSVAIATAAYFFLGALWYSPLLFGRMWAKVVHVTDADKKKMVPGMIGSAIIGAILSMGLSCLISRFHITGLEEGAKFGAGLWFFLVMPTHLSEVIWAKKPKMLFIINMAYKLVFFAGAGALFAAWQACATCAPTI